MKQISPILYVPRFNHFLVTLKEKQDNNILTYDIIFNKHKKIDIYKQENKELPCQYKNIEENDLLIQYLKQTFAFQRVEKAIHYFEEKMKNQLQIKNAKFERKNHNNRYIVSCEVVNPLFKSDFSYYHIEVLKDDSFEVIENNKIRMILDRENHRCLNKETGLQEYRTHRSFAQDIADLIVKDTGVRVRLLVN